MASVPDLTRAISFGGVALNTVTASLVNGKTVLIGCTVDSFDPTELEIRQFTEPLALADGIDVGGTWLGARKLSMRGTVYDKTRGETYARLATLEAAMIATSGTFGFSNLTWYTISGTTPTVTQKTVSVRPNGLRYTIDRDLHGGLDSAPLAIVWSVTFYAKDPAIT